jgi:hypothetical protein
MPNIIILSDIDVATYIWYLFYYRKPIAWFRYLIVHKAMVRIKMKKTQPQLQCIQIFADIVIFRKSTCNTQIGSSKVTLLTVVKLKGVVNDFF